MQIDYSTLNTAQKYALMSQSIIPRPIAWIVTESAEGIINAAPFSYFTGLSSQPPTVIVSIGHKSDGTPKDTLENIRKEKKCTICMVETSQLEAMHLSSKPLPHDRSETEYFHIPTQKIADGFPPVIQGTPTALFCTFYQEITLEGSKTIPLILEIKSQYIADDCVEADDGRFSVSFDPVARIGREYAFLGQKIQPPKIPD